MSSYGNSSQQSPRSRTRARANGEMPGELGITEDLPEPLGNLDHRAAVLAAGLDNEVAGPHDSLPERLVEVHVHDALDALLQKLAPVDLVIVEGFKRASLPKLEIYRQSVGKPLLHPEDPNIVAIASDRPLPSARLPVLAIDDIDAILETILARAATVEVPLEEAGSG